MPKTRPVIERDGMRLLACSACGREKELNTYNFSRHPSNLHGFAYVCKPCKAEQAAQYRKTLSDEYRKLDNANRSRNRLRRRITVLRHYSGGTPCCACCGETEIKFLAIDHINGGGNQHRQQGGMGGDGIFGWLKRSGYPVGFQVLCHNCNMAKGFYGVCPHKEAA